MTMKIAIVLSFAITLLLAISNATAECQTEHPLQPDFCTGVCCPAVDGGGPGGCCPFFAGEKTYYKPNKNIKNPFV